MAMFIMAANMAGIIGSQLFQASDSPKYTKGWSAIVSLLSVAVAACIAANVIYRVLNKRGTRVGKNSKVEAEAVGQSADVAEAVAIGDEKVKYQL